MTDIIRRYLRTGTKVACVMIRSQLLLLLTVATLVSCDVASVSEENDSTQPFSAFMTDEEIIDKAYDASFEVPAGFHIDERADTSGSFSIYHVKDTTVSYELCSDNFTEAFSWESADNENRSVNGTYVDSYENEQYFEIIRELSFPDSVGNISDPTSPGFSRVFKCSYVDRGGVDRDQRSGFAGTLNARPLTEDSLKALVEYLWQFTFFWPAQKTVLDSYSGDDGDEFEHTLVLALLTSQGTDECDLLEVVEWVFTVDKQSGSISKSYDPLFDFRTELVDGTPQKCES